MKTNSFKAFQFLLIFSPFIDFRIVQALKKPNIYIIFIKDAGIFTLTRLLKRCRRLIIVPLGLWLLFLFYLNTKLIITTNKTAFESTPFPKQSIGRNFLHTRPLISTQQAGKSDTFSDKLKVNFTGRKKSAKYRARDRVVSFSYSHNFQSSFYWNDEWNYFYFRSKPIQITMKMTYIRIGYSI